MGTSNRSRDILSRSFEDVGLILGGFLARTSVPESAAWILAGEILGSWFRGLSAAHSEETPEGIPGRSDRYRLHPSVRAVLAAIRSSSQNEEPSQGDQPGSCARGRL
jgi:hypothetical protein